MISEMSASGQLTSLYRIPIHKRIFDILIAITLLLTLAVLIVVIAIMIKNESKGGIIFRTKRVGANQRIFTLYKFRTMHDGSELLLHDMLHLNAYTNDDSIDKGTVFVKFKNDRRVTRVGQFLRRTHLDEIPQLINVIKGEMSIVGNRPLEIYEAENLIQKNEVLRFYTAAGITGLWQIRQYRKANLVEKERIELDNYYASKQSFAWDLRIMLETVPVLLFNIFTRR